MWFNSKHDVEITFKSGKTVTVTCGDFRVTKSSNNQVEKIEWERLASPSKILYINLDAIESILVK
jgi:hypothetical protein